MDRRYSVVALFFGMLLLIGCSGQSKIEGTVPAGGIVKQKGAAVEGATVTFAPAGGAVAAAGKDAPRAASGITDGAGQFKLMTLKPGDGAMPGEYLVTITKKELVGKEYTPEEANEYYNKTQKQPPSREVKQLLPAKYAQPATSGLKASVKKGEKNEFPFDLE